MKPPKPPTGKTLAAALGISERRIKQLKAAGMPCQSIAAAKAWRTAQTGKQDRQGDSAEELRQRRIGLLRQQERKAKLEADQAAGLLMPIGQHNEISYRCTMAAKTAFWNLLATLPPELEGLTAISILRVLQPRFRDTLQRLSDGDPLLWETPKSKRILELIDSEFPTPKL